jgi:catechol 2,3-dioxygenase-like lactoylglutathione lyase family enzyme
MAIVQLLQVSLCVRDLDRAVRFYRDLLGCRATADLAFEGAAPAASLGLRAGGFRSVLLERDGMRLELIAFSESAGATEPGDVQSSIAPNCPGLSHVTFVVDDLQATLQSLRDRGVAVREETFVEQAGGVATCLVRDPEGLLVLLYQRPAGVAVAEAALAEGAPLDEGESDRRGDSRRTP